MFKDDKFSGIYGKTKERPDQGDFQRILITNRRLCEKPLIRQLEQVLEKTNPLTANPGESLDSPVDVLLLREKDLPEAEYETLAKEVLLLCQLHGVRCVLHTYVDVARRLNCPCIHLPLPLLKQYAGQLNDFTLIGSSVHSVEEAQKAWKLGASYVMAGHVFATDCKKGLPPRGLEFLQKVCESVPIPVYALGGMTAEREAEVKDCGARGACRMSDYMRMGSGSERGRGLEMGCEKTDGR